MLNLDGKNGAMQHPLMIDSPRVNRINPIKIKQKINEEDGTGLQPTGGVASNAFSEDIVPDDYKSETSGFMMSTRKVKITKASMMNQGGTEMLPFQIKNLDTGEISQEDPFIREACFQSNLKFNM